MKKYLPIVLTIIAVAAGVLAFWFASKDDHAAYTANQKSSGAIVDSTPLEGAVFAAQPINITINANQEVAGSSTISVKDLNGDEWTDGDVRTDALKKSTQKDLKQGMEDGTYVVQSSMCFAADFCIEKSFDFRIDSTLQKDYTDLRGKESVTIEMNAMAFSPQKVMVSPGTAVTWVNKESAQHFVSTETPDSATYYPQQNSSTLEINDTFATIFVIPGEYDYHCSLHVFEGMTGSILVLD